MATPRSRSSTRRNRQESVDVESYQLARQEPIDVESYQLTRNVNGAWEDFDFQDVKSEPRDLSIIDTFPDHLVAQGFSSDAPGSAYDAATPDAATWEAIGEIAEQESQRAEMGSSVRFGYQEHRPGTSPRPLLDDDSMNVPQPVSSENENYISVNKDFFLKRDEQSAGKKRRLTQAEKERALVRQLRDAQRMQEQLALETYGEATNTKGVCSKDDGNQVQVSDDEGEASQSFSKMKAVYEKKRTEGKTTTYDDIQYIQAKQAEDHRLKYLDREEEDERDEDEDYFMDDADCLFEDEDLFVHDDDDEITTIRPSRKPRKPRTRQAPQFLGTKRRTAKETPGYGRKGVTPEEVCESMIFGFEMAIALAEKCKYKPRYPALDWRGDDVPKQKKRKRTAAGVGLGTGSRKVRGPSKGDSRPIQLYSSTNFENLMDSDVFKSAAANADIGYLPSFQRENLKKVEILKQMISSLPAEARRHAAHDRKVLDEAHRTLTHPRSVTPTNEGWKIKGMLSSLYDYQYLGLSFMRNLESERHEDKVRGGIIADTMGLGKTVMMLANMVDGRPKTRGDLRPTLIIVRPSLISQWEAEIKQHCQSNIFPDVEVYEAKNYAKARDYASILESKDIVIVGYNAVMRSYPMCDLPEEASPGKQWTWWVNRYTKEAGPLHQIKWLRVVCDECDAIKNCASRTAIAVTSLMAQHRWLMSGTIATNDIDEFYSFFKFLRVPLARDMTLFESNFLADQKARERLHQMLFRYMMRRTHDTKLFGKPILQLPPATRFVTKVAFSKLERMLHDVVWERCRLDIEYRVENGLTNQLGVHIFVRLLLLRQIASHFFCGATLLVKLLRKEDMDRIKAICEEAKSDPETPADQLVHLKKMFFEIERRKDVLLEDNNITHGRANNIGKALTRNVDVSSYFDQIIQEDLQARGRLPRRDKETVIEGHFCSECQKQPRSCVILEPCGHHICAICLVQVQDDAVHQGLDQSVCPFPGCDHGIEGRKGCDREQGVEWEANRKTTESERIKSWAMTTGQMYPSAKAKAIKAAVLNWKQENPLVKIIVFTQFLPMIEVMAFICTKEKWEFKRFTGSMDRRQKDVALEQFRGRNNTNILLASLKSGGVGLNLTAATKVLLVDMWWNSAMDYQAFCRVWRIGQTKETILHRLAVDDSIDDYLLSLQDKKDEEIRDVLDGPPGRANPMELKPLLALFGIDPTEVVGVDGSRMGKKRRASARDD